MITPNLEVVEMALKLIQEGRHTYANGQILSKRTGRPLGYCAGKNGNMAYDIGGRHAAINRVVFALHYGMDELKKWEVIEHINGDKSDNRIENLRGVSRVESIQLAKTRRRKGKKLTFEQVTEIKKRLRNGETLKLVAADYGVSLFTISSIKTGRTFSYID